MDIERAQRFLKPRDQEMILKIGHALVDHTLVEQDDFEMAQRIMLEYGEISEMQYYEAVIAYRTARETPQ